MRLPPRSTLPGCLNVDGAARALEALDRARRLALDANRAVWDFAVEIDALRELGLADSDLRWLQCRGYVISAEDLTEAGEGRRRFGPSGSLRFSGRTCFALVDTPTGEGLDTVAAPSLTTVRPHPTQPASALGLPRPSWDADRRVLQVLDRTVKHFRVPADNQETILDAFEEEGWPARIADPLRPVPFLEPKRRLQSAIMCLNRNQLHRLLRFRGNGTGTGVTWELCA